MAIAFKQDHAQACEQWRLMTAAERGEILSRALDRLALLTGDVNQARQLFAHLLAQTDELDTVTELTGATGESNELYVTARGKTMVIGCEPVKGDSQSGAKVMPVLAQMLAALLTGNEVILHFPSQPEMCDDAVAALYQAGIANDVISIANDSQTGILLHMNRLAQVAVVGSVPQVRQIAADLAASEGILTQVIAVTEQNHYGQLFDPDYLHRFVTERVRTINTTAIGGNASLLELGVEG